MTVLLQGNGHSSCFLKLVLSLDRYLHMNPDIQNHPSRVKTIFKVPNIYTVLAGLVITTNAVSATITSKLYKQCTVSIDTSATGTFSIFISFSFSYGLRRVALQHSAGFQEALHLLYKTMLKHIMNKKQNA